MAKGMKKYFEFEGKRYDVLAMSVEMHAELKGEILSRRPNALAEAKNQIEGLPEDVQRIIISEAIKADMSREVSMAEMDRFVRTMDGIAFLAFTVVRRDKPDVTMDRIIAAINDEARAAIQLLDVADEPPAGKDASVGAADAAVGAMADASAQSASAIAAVVS